MDQRRGVRADAQRAEGRMKALVPHRFTTTTARNLDMEKVNDDLEAIAGDVNRNLGNRYTYSTHVFHVDGLSNASSEVLRSFIIRRPGTNNGAEIFGVELSLYATGTAIWTATCSDTSWPAFSVTAAGSSVESYGSSPVPVSIPSSSSHVQITLAADGASTIVRGDLVIHLRCDRGNQGTSHAGYTPTLIDSTSSTAGSLLDTQLTAAALAVTNDTTNNVDLRCECFVARVLLAGESRILRLPSGARRKLFADGKVAGALAQTVTFSVDGTSFPVVGTGSATTYASGTAALSGTLVDDPMDPSDDTIVTIANAAGVTIDCAYLLVWFS